MGNLLTALGLSRHLSEAPPEEPVGDYSADVMPPARSRTTSLDRALSLPAVYRAIQVISGMGSQLTVNSWRGQDRVDPAPGLVSQPDPWRPLSSWLERLLVCLATDGNAFLVKTRGADNQVVALEVANPYTTFIHWRRTAAGAWVKEYDIALRGGKRRTYPASEVEHVWAMEVPGRDRGLGPIGACRLALTGILDLREYADGWFQNGDVPSGVLSSDQRLDPDQAKRYKEVWRNPDGDLPEEQRGRGPQVRVLGQGLSYEPVTLKPEDAQWLEAQRFGILDIARMFGLPGDYLLAAVEGTSLTYANLEMIDAQFLRTTLFPVYLRKVEAALTACLPRGQEARFDTSALLRPDAKTRAQVDAIYLPLGVDTPENVARREGRPVGTPTPTRNRQETPA